MIDLEERLTTYIGDCLSILPTLPAESVDCVVTSPPYWQLRDYGASGRQKMGKDKGSLPNSATFRNRDAKRRLVGTFGNHLGKAKSDARKCNRQACQCTREDFPFHEGPNLFLRCRYRTAKAHR